jgi:hypothetical protein
MNTVQPVRSAKIKLNGSETAQIGWPQVSGYVPLTNPVGSMQMAGDIVMPPASRSEPNDGGDLAGRKTATISINPFWF